MGVFPCNTINRRVEGQIAFNDTWYENLKGTNTFIDKRCNWPIIFKIFEKEAKFKDSTLVREDMSLLGKNINLVGNFVTYYGKKVEGFEKNYSEILKAVLVTPQITEYSGLINKKKKMIDELFSPDELAEITSFRDDVVPTIYLVSELSRNKI